MYTPKIAIDYSQGHNGSWLQYRPGKQIIPKQNNPVAHLHHPYFIIVIGQHRNLILCYKAGYKTR